MNALLYILLIFAWGSSWIAINFQISDVSSVVSVFYRFSLAGMIMFPISLALGKIQVTRIKDHMYFMLQGCFLFCLNFLCFYYASHYLVSGLIAVIFSLATVFNVINEFLFFKIKPNPNQKMGVVIGIVGLLLVFINDIVNINLDFKLAFGVGLSFLGVYFFSLGNMVSVRNGRAGITSVTSTNYAIIYGSVVLLLICLFNNEVFSFEMTFKYVGGLLFLSTIATIFGFTAYLKLIDNIGASMAAYILVITPIVALLFSSMFESYVWTTNTFVGIMFVAVGNYIGNKKVEKAI